MNRTFDQFDQIAKRCRAVFEAKLKDYGTSWRILRPSSLTDQLFIKARRIRSIEEKGVQLVADGIEGEFAGLFNYGIIALIQLGLADDAPLELPHAQALDLYDRQVALTRDLLGQKNHDYGEAWRDMRVSSMTDLILAKIYRIKQIEDNQGKTEISEGADANYRDIINYAAFSLIKIMETAKNESQS